MSAGRLTSDQFGSAFREGTRGTGEYVSVFVRPNGTAQRRIGVTVGRRFGNAVRRNRLRRRLREAFRDLEGELPAGIDVVCAPRGRAAAAAFTDLVSSLQRALRDAGALPLRAW